MGTPEFAIPSLEHLVLNQYQVVAVYTQPDKPSGRGRSLVSPPLKKVAEKLNIPVVQLASLNEAHAIAQLTDFHPDVIVVAAFGHILPQTILDIPVHGCINIHPSLLPKYRGPSPVATAILAGDEFTGVSIMLITRRIDSGPILSRAQIPISAQDTTGSLMAKLSLVAAQLLTEVLVHWLCGELTPQSQNENEATFSRLISKEEGEIDWNLTATDIWRLVRAFQPWPECYTRWQGKLLKIIEAVPIDGEGAFEVGQVITLPPTGEPAAAAFGVHTGKGILGVCKLQLAGKRPMSGDEFLRGQRQFMGAILPS
jgi:methionyl-tRNA formyltransferase